MTFSNLDQAVRHFFPGEQGITQRRGQGSPPEAGVDVGLPAGYIVQAVSGGTYRRDLSTPYQTTLQTPSGLLESYTHIVPTKFTPGEYVDQGTIVGTIFGGKSISVPGNKYYPAGAYSSSGPHLEFGVGAPGATITTPWDFFNLGKTVDPTATLTGVKAEPPHYGSPIPDITVPSGADVIGAIKGALPALFVGGAVYIIVAILVLVLILRR